MTTQTEDGKEFFGRWHLSRRELLNWFLGTSAGALIISTLCPVTRYIVPPRVEESTARTVTLSIKPEDIKANSGQIFKFGSQPGILIRTPDGDLRAFTAIAPISLASLNTGPTSVTSGARAITVTMISTESTSPARLRDRWSRML